MRARLEAACALPHVQTNKRDPELRSDSPAACLAWGVVGLCLLFMGWLAWWGRSDMLLYGDEYLSIEKLGRSFGELMGSYDERGTGVGLLVLQKLSVQLLGANPIAYRMPATLAAMASLVLVYRLGRAWVGGWAALLAVPLLASSSLLIHYARFGRTYSLLVCLMLVFVWGVERHQREPRALGRAGLGVLLAGGVLPWLHLTSLPSLGLVGLYGLWRTRAQRAIQIRLCCALSGAGVLAAALMLPARLPMLQFFHDKSGAGRPLEAGVLDLAALFVGTRAGGAVVLVLAGFGLVVLIRARRPAAGFVLLALLVPLAAVLLARPSGAIYAFARYQISALPFLFLSASVAIVQVCRSLPGQRQALALLPAGGLAAALFLGGPAFSDAAAFSPFAAANPSLFPMPPFDARWKGMPAFYSRLAELDEDVRVLELPEQISRSVLLYRNYWLTHRKRVSMGFMITRKRERVPGGPHVNLRAGELAGSDVDYVIYHKNIQEELARYWVFVHTEAWDLGQDPGLMPFMQAQGNFGKRFEERKISRKPLAELGQPFYEDRFIQVWKLR